MILGFFFLFHFLEVLSGREGFFAKKGGVSLVRNRDLRPAAKANPTIQQAFERFQKYNRLKNLSQGSLDFYAAKGRSFFRFLGDTEQPIHTITEETVEDYIFYMKDQQLHDTTINTNLRMVRAFLYWCIGRKSSLSWGTSTTRQMDTLKNRCQAIPAHVNGCSNMDTIYRKSAQQVENCEIRTFGGSQSSKMRTKFTMLYRKVKNMRTGVAL